MTSLKANILWLRSSEKRSRYSWESETYYKAKRNRWKKTSYSGETTSMTTMHSPPRFTHLLWNWTSRRDPLTIWELNCKTVITRSKTSHALLGSYKTLSTDTKRDTSTQWKCQKSNESVTSESNLTIFARFTVRKTIVLRRQSIRTSKSIGTSWWSCSSSWRTRERSGMSTSIWSTSVLLSV